MSKTPLTIDGRRKGRSMSVMEAHIYSLLQKYFPRVEWQINEFYLELKSPTTGYSLQLDFYAPSIGLAVEANDQSHRSLKVFQSYGKGNTPDKFEARKRNDQTKSTQLLILNQRLWMIDYGTDIKEGCEDQILRYLSMWASELQVKVNIKKEPNITSGEMLFFIVVTALWFYIVYWVLRRWWGPP